MAWRRERIRSLLRSPLILSFYLPALVFSVCDGLLVPVLPLFAKELDASYGLVGLVLAARGVGMLLGDVPSGVLTARLGGKRSMLLGIGLSVLSTVTLFGTNSILLAVWWRLLSGFGYALWSVSRHAYIAEAVSVRNRGRAISLLGGVFRVGRFVGPVVGGLAADLLGLRSTFLLVGLFGAAAMALVVAYVSPTAAAASQRTLHRSHGGHLWNTVKAHSRVLVSAGTGQLLAQTIRAGRTLIVPLYAADVLGLDVVAVGSVLSISAAESGTGTELSVLPA